MDLVADRDDLLGRLDVALGHLGDVDEALDAVADLDEHAERDELGDLALDDRADREVLDELLPRILRGLLEAERDALAVEVDVEHLHVDLVADLDDLGRVVDVAPRQLGDVHETVDAAEVDERAEVDDARRRCPAGSCPSAACRGSRARSCLRPSSRTTRRERTTLLRLRSISMTRPRGAVPR